MTNDELMQKAREYMAALPTPSAVTQGQAPAQIAAAVAAHCPLAVSLIVQMLVSQGFTAKQCPDNAPFAVAHTWRLLYAGNHMGTCGYSPVAPDTDNDDMDWPEYGAALLECWLAADPANMGEALTYITHEMTRPLRNGPPSITTILYLISDAVYSDFEDADLRKAPPLIP